MGMSHFFYEIWGNDFIIHKNDFKTSFLLVHVKFDFYNTLNTKYGYISNFYENLANEFMVYKEDFKTIEMLVQAKFNFSSLP